MTWLDSIGQVNYDHGKYWNETWNVVTGCTPISIGCENCWAEAYHKRFKKPFEVKLHPEKLDQPMRWRKPRVVFVCNTGDLFHEDVPVDFIKRVIRNIGRSPEHIFLVLTKRSRRMLDIISCLYEWSYQVPNNIWLGVTVEHSDYEHRIDDLLDTPAAHRFVSYEPALGPVDFSRFNKVGWIIYGAESGPNRRPMELEWAEDVVEYGKANNIPIFVKQLSFTNGKGKIEVIKDMNKFYWPPDLAVRELPEV